MVGFSFKEKVEVGRSLWPAHFIVGVSVQVGALLQSTVEPEFMGRVFSVFTMVSSSMMPLGMLLFGPAADTVNINIILVGTGIIIALMSMALVSNKTLREAGNINT